MSSLNDKKSALFAKTVPSAASAYTQPTTNANNNNNRNNNSSSISSASGYGVPGNYSGNNNSSSSSATSSTMPVLSAAVKEKKLNEAKEHIAKGEQYLQTSMFQWAPDHLGAAPCFDKAANIYKGINETQKAMEMFVRAATSHEQASCQSSAALAYVSASTLAKTLNKPDLAGKYLEEAGVLYGTNGDIDKCAEFFAKAAVEFEKVNDAKAVKLYEKAIDLYYPASSASSVEKLKAVNIRALDALRGCLAYNVKKKKFAAAIKLAEQRMIPLYRAFEYDQALFKLCAGICIILLAMDDIVQADKKFVQEHFSYPGYLASIECELTESFIMAFKQGNPELLHQAQSSPEVMYLEKEILDLAQSLKIITMDMEDELVVGQNNNKPKGQDNGPNHSNPNSNPSSQPQQQKPPQQQQPQKQSSHDPDYIDPKAKASLFATGKKTTSSSSSSSSSATAPTAIAASSATVVTAATTAVSTVIATKNNNSSSTNNNKYEEEEEGDEEEDFNKGNDELLAYYASLAATTTNGDNDDNILDDDNDINYTKTNINSKSNTVDNLDLSMGDDDMMDEMDNLSINHDTNNNIINNNNNNNTTTNNSTNNNPFIDDDDVDIS